MPFFYRINQFDSTSQISSIWTMYRQYGRCQIWREGGIGFMPPCPSPPPPTPSPSAHLPAPCPPQWQRGYACNSDEANIRGGGKTFTSSLKGQCHRCKRYRRQNCCRYQRQRRQILPPVLPVLLIPVSTTPVGICHQYIQGLRGNWFTQKNQKSKISWHCPFKHLSRSLMQKAVEDVRSNTCPSAHQHLFPS